MLDKDLEPETLPFPSQYSLEGVNEAEIIQALSEAESKAQFIDNLIRIMGWYDCDETARMASDYFEETWYEYVESTR